MKNLIESARATLDKSAQEKLYEGRMKELHGYMEKGMSAKDIAKKMRLDVKTIQALMPKKESFEEKYQSELSQQDVDHICESKYHVCAVVVEHPEWGEGKPLIGRHAEPDDAGNVAWYDVEFSHGIEEKVEAEGLNILDEMSHGKKKKTEDAMQNVTSADKKPQNFRKPDGSMGVKMVPTDPRKKVSQEKMDPVGKEDDDIDNDGDVDSSDKYLKNRRKAIKKNINRDEPEGKKGDTATMRPTAEGKYVGPPKHGQPQWIGGINSKNAKAIKTHLTNKGHSFDDHSDLKLNRKNNTHYISAHSKEGHAEIQKVKTKLGLPKNPYGTPGHNKAQDHRGKADKADLSKHVKHDSKASYMKESSIREALRAVLENDRAKHYKGATKPETMDDRLSGKGAKDMMEPAKNAKVDDTEEKGHQDASKAGKTGPQAKARGGSDATRSGDQKIIPSATPAKGIKKTMEAYASMYKKEADVSIDEGLVGDMLAKRKEHKAMASKIKTQQDYHHKQMNTHHGIADRADKEGRDDTADHHNGKGHDHSVAKDHMANALAAHNKKDYKARDKHISSYQTSAVAKKIH